MLDSTLLLLLCYHFLLGTIVTQRVAVAHGHASAHVTLAHTDNYSTTSLPLYWVLLFIVYATSLVVLYMTLLLLYYYFTTLLLLAAECRAVGEYAGYDCLFLDGL